MKKVLKIVLALVLVFVLGISALLAYVSLVLPSVGDAPEMVVNVTPERLARGEYLANSVVGCVACHSERNFSKFAGPIDPASHGKGGELFGSKMGFPGEYFAPNITPKGIADWTDGELFRAITMGVSKDGRALFPIMPYPHFAKMDQEDILSIIAYIRTLPPVESTVPASSSAFPMNFIINTIPQQPTFNPIPPKEELLKYGEYMTNASLCMDCHTIQIKGEYQMDQYMAGGFEIPLPDGGIVRSTNITPDKKTGIGNWTEAQFVARFKQYADSTYQSPDVAPGEFNTYMPWTNYSNMKEEDLQAIYTYLQSIKPVENMVVRFEPSKPQ